MSTKIQIRNLILEKRKEFHVKDKYVFVLIDQDGYLIEGEINNKTFGEWKGICGMDAKKAADIDFADISKINKDLNNAIKDVSVAAFNISKALE